MEPRTDQQTARRRILVVDGDAQIQRLLDVSLRAAGFDVHTVASATEGLVALATARPDLIVSETTFASGPDGFGFCRQVKQAKPSANGGAIPFIFLAEQSVETKVRSVEAGADDFLAKPLYAQEVVARVGALLQRREHDRLEGLARGDEPFVGQIDVLPLVDLLRSIQANRRSGVAHLASPAGVRGDVYFRDGGVVDAEVGRLSGLDALCRLFSWTDGSFEIEWKQIRRKDAVAMEPGALLMEALRRLDEWRRLLGELPSVDTIFEVDYHLLAERLAEIPDEVNSILRLFDGQRSLMRVIDDCGFSDLDALAIIGKLYREQIVRDGRMRPEMGTAPGAELEGWITDSVGPFRGAPARERRDLFGAPPDVPMSVHARVTAPVDPLEDGARDAVSSERRERFTDRLIAEGAATAVEAAPTPIVDAPETTRMGLGITPPPAPSPAGDALERTQLGLAPPPMMPPRSNPETTQQGIGTGTPLSTKPGFAAAAPSPAREARAMSIEVAPLPEGVASRGVTDGTPQIVAPQSPEPTIVLQPPSALPPPSVAPAVIASVATAPLSGAPAPGVLEPRAGEILAHAPTQAMDARVTAGPGVARRNTDLGLGPDRPADVAGELAATTPREPPKPPEIRKKIILDQDVPEEEEARPRVSNGLKLAIVGVVTLGVFGGGFFLIKKTTRHGRVETTSRAAVTDEKVAAAVVPVVAPATDAAGLVDAQAEIAAASPPPVASAGHTHGAPISSTKKLAAGAPVSGAIVDERSADPKVARALPTEFPQLLGACRTAFGEKRAKDAEIACTAAKDANPDSPEACALLAHALFNRKKRHEAMQWAERSIQLDANHADAYVIIGGVKQANDDARGAKAAYKRYLELAPTGQYAADLRAIVDSL